MDAARFDALARSLSLLRPSRRGALAGLAGGLLAGMRLDIPRTAAKKKKKKKITLCHEGQTIKVSKKAKKQHLAHGDTLGACSCQANCEGKICGDNGCGGSCGQCGAEQVCADGACQDRCPTGQHVCGAECIPLGACCPACPGGAICDKGVCVFCADGEAACGTYCANPRTDPENCGACGNACAGGCLNGACECTPGSCPNGCFCRDTLDAVSACAGGSNTSQTCNSSSLCPLGSVCTYPLGKCSTVCIG